MNYDVGREPFGFFRWCRFYFWHHAAITLAGMGLGGCPAHLACLRGLTGAAMDIPTAAVTHEDVGDFLGAMEQLAEEESDDAG